MCQLIFSNLGNTVLNRVFIISQMMEDSEVVNNDGYGVLGNKLIYRSIKTPALDFIEFGKVSQEIILETPVLAHVRQASNSFGKKSISLENTHPFKNADIILAHNGSLELKDKNIEEEYKNKGIIDSQIFLDRLFKNKREEFPEKLSETMKEFTGTFAFLIRYKKTFYAARGKTKTLYYADILNDKPIGYVINTQRTDLERNLRLFCSLYNLTYSEIKLLKEESIFELDDVVSIVGKIEEEYKEPQKKYETKSITIPEIPKVFKELEEMDLTLGEISLIVGVLSGRYLGACSDKEFEVTKEIIGLLNGRNSRLKRKVWKQIKILSNLPALQIYIDNNEMDFPYMYNDVKILSGVLKRYEDINKTIL